MDWTCLLCENGCVTLKNTSVIVCRHCGSYSATVMDRAYATSLAVNANLMFNSCSKVQRNELKYHRQMDFARFSVCLRRLVNPLSRHAAVLL